MIAIPQNVLDILRALNERGHEAYVVGGCVRDSLQGRTPTDWDVTTSALPEETAGIFDALGGYTVAKTGLAHGTLTIIKEHCPVEITTYRVDGAYSDARHPDAVRFTRSLREDLSRRDFTINAMAYHPDVGLVDYFSGRADLEARRICCVGDPDKRFGEDALRILRGVRFASELGFAIEGNTAAAMRRQLGRLSCVAAERVREELTRLLCGRWAQRTLLKYNDIIGAALPELVPMFGCTQDNPHHCYDVWGHTVRAVGQVPSEPCLRWAMLLHDSGKPACKTVDEQGVGHFRGHPKHSRALAGTLLPRLRFSKEDTERILLLVEQHDRPLGDSEKLVRRSLARLGEARFRDLLMIKKGDAVGQNTQPWDVGTLCATERMLNEVLRQNACLSLRQLAVNGHDMQALGLGGAAIGGMLRYLLDAVLDDESRNRREILLRLARTEMEENYGQHRE